MTITATFIKNLLDKQVFRLHHSDKSQVVRMVDIADGLSVHEYSEARIIRGLPSPTIKRKYKVNAYQGSHAKSRWLSSGLVSLTKAVQFANAMSESAHLNWNHDQQ